MNKEVKTQLERLNHGGILSADDKGNMVFKKPRQFVHTDNGEVCVTVSIRQSSVEEKVIILSANAPVAHELTSFFDWLDAHCYKYWYRDPGHCLHSL
ncbi:MAG TPA: hypothetical protein PLX10_00375 [Candidatus Paceibacterota bacterium]|nr:hypothetical protein [Candidatus Paceibacterota bacterium]